MMRVTTYVLLAFVVMLGACNRNKPAPVQPAAQEQPTPAPLVLDLDQANKLAALPLACIGTEYPNKLGQTLGSDADLLPPTTLHPAFYGCFDWHSAVHGHWSLVYLVKHFPELAKRDSIIALLEERLSPANIQAEAAYFDRELEGTFERTYGWSWLLKLALELHTWDAPEARTLESNLQPLTEKIITKYLGFLPKLQYPIRVGTHSNLAFGLTFAYDYALAVGHDSLAATITETAMRFYAHDVNCPLNWEPNGYDFLSPCLEEANLMARILPQDAFDQWIDGFIPDLNSPDFTLQTGRVGDREDGLLVHLDGLNFSRAWCLYYLAGRNQRFAHLRPLAQQHIAYSLPNLFGDSYEGGHWLGSFAILALDVQE